MGVSWTPPYGIKTESIPEPKVRSRNQSFLVKRNRNRSIPHGHVLLESESESAPVFQSGIGIDSGQLESSTSLHCARLRNAANNPVRHVLGQSPTPDRPSSAGGRPKTAAGHSHAATAHVQRGGGAPNMRDGPCTAGRPLDHRAAGPGSRHIIAGATAH